MDYLVLDAGCNFGKEDASVMFATNDLREAVEAANDFGQGTVVLFVGRDGSKQRVFTAPYNEDLAIEE